MGRYLDFLRVSGQDGHIRFFKGLGSRGIMLAGLAVIGMILLLYGSTRPDEQYVEQTVNIEGNMITSRSVINKMIPLEEEQLNMSLSKMLGQIKGAGKVEVSVRLSGSTKAEYAVNSTTGKKITQELDKSGGTRLITEDSDSGQLVISRKGNDGDQPVVERESSPQLAGVLVVAEGAGDARVKARLFEATKVALGIEPHKIVVLPMERRIQ